MDQKKPSLVLGILGGGQLGRMSALAAARLGIDVVIYCPENNSPASAVVAETVLAPYDDRTALKTFAEKVDFISYEFENIPVETIDYLETLKPDCIFPKQNLLDVSQDRLKEKAFLNDLGIETARWAAIHTLDDIQNTIDDWSCERFILKTTRFGYDGKGQIKCDAANLSDNIALAEFLENTKDQNLIMEDCVPFISEISIIVARDYTGKTECYGPMLNAHRNHILYTTKVPSGVSKNIQELAINMAQRVADSVDLRGVLTIEYFVCNDDTLLANEIAPRTHNSGHWSIDVCTVSQFENHVRTVCGLNVGSTTPHSDAVMLNLIGDDIGLIKTHNQTPGACIHDYGKHTIRDGRKMGHITFLNPENLDFLDDE